MRTSWNDKPQNLDEWVGIATKRLVPLARERIRSEIETHYTEAVAEHVADGSSESDARVVALAELGNAKAAGRRFRKRYLTLRDVQYIEQARKLGVGIGALLLNYFFFGACLLMIRDSHQSPAIPASAGFLLLVAVPTILFVMARRARPNLRLVLLAAYLNTWNFFVLVEVFFLLSNDAHDWLTGVVLLLLILGSPFSPFRFWRKLRNADDGWWEIPPRNAASS
jgi:hypothetical protein